MMKETWIKKRRLAVFWINLLILATLFTGCQSKQPQQLHADAENWAYLETEDTEKAADVFFIAPTVYGGDEKTFNMALDDQESREDFKGAINMEKGIYQDTCRMFAPYYRQAALNVYEMEIPDREPYLSVAYEDIKQAFEYYLDHHNEGRPIVLAGFSQGGDLSIRLLKDYFSDETLQDRLIACYALGWSITEEEMEADPHLKFAEGESDVGVIVSFNSEAEDVTDSLTIPEGTKTLAINPLNWKTDSTPADRSLNKGACFTNYSGEIKEEIPELTGAYIDETRGALKVPDVTPEEYPAGLSIFEDGEYHLYDYQFFYRNLQENVAVRTEAFKRHKLEDIVVLYTNDVHCGITGDIGYDGLAAYKKAMEKAYQYVTLVDCGDAVQGDFIGTVSEGEYVVDIMNQLDYDFAITGNHEFDYGMEQLSALIDRSEAQYLGCNITYTGTGDNLLADIKPYEIVDYGDSQVAYIGVATPESYTKSTPAYFMEDGEYVYDFAQGENGQNLYSCVQGYVDECREQGADYVVLLSHLGDLEESSPYTSVELIQATSGVDVVLDGHAHNVIYGLAVDNSQGEDVLLSSTGTKLGTFGKLVIGEDGEITTELICGYSDVDPECTAVIDEIQSEYETEMNKVIATSDIALSCNGEDGARMVRNRETAIGNLCADAFREIGGADIAFINGGGIRADIPQGDITYTNMLAVQPFGNTLCVAEATGQEILDLLETAYMHTLPVASENGQALGESGSFLQVSGLQCVIDTSIPSSVKLDEYENFVSVEREHRVKDVMVLKEDGTYEPLDLEGTYTVSSYNYILKEGGNSYGGFMDNTYVISEGISDYQVLTQYITEVLGGNLGENYGQPQGRITIQ